MRGTDAARSIEPAHHESRGGSMLLVKLAVWATRNNGAGGSPSASFSKDRRNAIQGG
jgi:hypothetical protein